MLCHSTQILITEYNDKLIDEYNAMIEQNKQKRIDLNNKQIQLADKLGITDKAISKYGYLGSFGIVYRPTVQSLPIFALNIV